MVANVNQFLGKGMLYLNEAAMYARVSPQLLSRWMFDRDGTSAALIRQVEGSDKVLTFVDFIQALTVRSARTQKKIALQKIRQAVITLRDQHGIEYPFARQHELFEFDNDIVYQPISSNPIFVSGKERNQHLMQPIIQEHMRAITFDRDGIAQQLIVHSEDGIDITMRANSRFGEPMMPSGYTAQTLWNAVTTEGGYDRAAKAYEVDVRELRSAFRYYDSLGLAA